MSTRDCDLLIVGSGPAGMSAAINGASEGLKVCLLDAQQQLGGQARESSAIENYPGFPDGITGEEFMSRLAKQASKFATDIHAPVNAVELTNDSGSLVVTADDYSQYSARAVLLTIGLSYRRLHAEGIGEFMGRGVFYGLPGGSVIPRKKCTAVVVGGANSAGQAVLRLAQNPNANITMVIRRKVTDQMSKYLIDRIRDMPNVEVREGVEVVKCEGNKSLERIYLSDGEEICAGQLFIFIGAVPKTHWLQKVLELDEKRFIRTWTDLPAGVREERLPYETGTLGVFAAGDVRLGSVKRIASGVGEGAGALQMIHRRLSN